MASPFKIFRRHQKVWMAVLTVLAMFAFVFITAPVMDIFSRTAAGDPVVVRTTKFGNLTASQLGNLEAVHRALVHFIKGIGEDLAQAGIRPVGRELLSQ